MKAARDPKSTLDIALEWRALGVATIPIRAGSKAPALASWKPYQTQLPTEVELQTWFQSGRYGLAVITGWRGLTVLDWDDMDVYRAWMDGLEDDRQYVATWTYSVITSRGLHLYYLCKDHTQSIPGTGWDIKAAGGYVVAPPSIHPSGHQYATHNSPEHVRQIDSIWWLLGIEKPTRPVFAANAEALDPFDAAYISTETNGDGHAFEDIKATHSIAAMLGLPLSSRVQKLQCPLPGHADEHSSFALYPDGHGHCFGCGFHGDVIDFWASMHGAPLIEALRALANEHK